MPKQDAIYTKVFVDDPWGIPRDISTSVRVFDPDDTTASLDQTGVDDLTAVTANGRSAGNTGMTLNFDRADDGAWDIFRRGVGIARTLTIQEYDANGNLVATYSGEMQHFGLSVAHGSDGALTGTVTLRNAPGSTGSWS